MNRNRRSRCGPVERAKQCIAAATSEPPGFYTALVSEEIGRGLFTSVEFKEGDFLLTYKGQLSYEEPLTDDTYIFEVVFNRKKCWIDATKEDGSYGRFINDSVNRPNCHPKVIRVNDVAHIAFFAIKAIKPGEELRYKYGDAEYPWRTKVKNGKSHMQAKTNIQVFTFSGLVPFPEKDDIEKFMSCSKFEFSLDLSKEVTHLIVSTCADKRHITNRTTQNMLKAVLMNIKIVSKEWMFDSIASGTLLPEENYYVQGDHLTGHWPRSRKRQFSINCQLLGEFQGITKDELHDLLLMMGAEFTEDPDVIIIEDDAKNTNLMKSLIGSKATIIGKEWVLHSILQDMLLPTEDFKIDDIVHVVDKDHADAASSDIASESEPEIDDTDIDEEYFPDSEMDTDENDEIFPDSSPIKKTKEQQKGNLEIEDDSREMDTDEDAEIITDISPMKKTKEQQKGNLKIGDISREMDTDEDAEIIPDISPIKKKKEQQKGNLKIGDISREMDTDEDAEIIPDISPMKKTKEQQKGNLEIEDDSENGSVSQVIQNKAVGKEVLVQLPIQKKNGKRSEKLHACVFCNSLFSKLPRHFEQMHKDEVEVAKILIMPKRSKNRKVALASLCNKGDYDHNFGVLERGSGVLIPKYRSRKGEERPVKDFIPCQFCLALYIKTDLWKHQQKCEQNKKKKTGLKPVASGRLLLPSNSPSDLHLAVLTKMKEDDIKTAIEGDRLVLEFGCRLIKKHGTDPQYQYYISQKLRELGRLLLVYKETEETSLINLEECLLPSNWNKLIKAVQTLAGYNPVTGQYSIPSLSLKLGHSLHKCAKILKTEAIMNADQQKRQNAEGFVELYDCEWAERISGAALTTLNVNRFNKPKLLPLVADVVGLHSYLKVEIQKIKKILMEKPSRTYKDFASLCLTQLILFNRRRSGEAQRIKISDFENGMKLSIADEDVKKSLTSFEIKLCETHKRIEIMGKKGRKVAVILTEAMTENLQLLRRVQELLDFQSVYLFGIMDSVHPYRGNDTLRKHAVDSGAKAPELLTSTKLRKQLATLSQVLNLQENSQDMLANFMGHNIRVHREFYRLPESTLEVAKVAKVLHLINKGDISQYRDKDLDAIEIDSTEDAAEDTDDDDDDDDDGDNNDSAINNAPMSVGTDILKKTKGKKSQIVSKSTEKRLWTKAEKDALERHFRKAIRLRKVPGKKACDEARVVEPVLSSRTWQNIKYAIKNAITKRNFGVDGTLKTSSRS